jgi:hypothetical protein
MRSIRNEQIISAITLESVFNIKPLKAKPGHNFIIEALRSKVRKVFNDTTTKSITSAQSDLEILLAIKAKATNNPLLVKDTVLTDTIVTDDDIHFEILNLNW